MNFKELYFRIFGPIKRKKFNCTDFSIISNNCFGGIVYRNNRIPYLTPTAGLFFMPKDYLKFIKNLDYYLNCELVEISVENSNHRDYLDSKNYEGIIGKLDDIEIIFLHYDTFLEAKEKWIKRSKRINYNKLIFKFNDQNGCELDDLKEFQNFKAENKILFTAKKYPGIDSYVLSQYADVGYVVEDNKEKSSKKVFNIYDYVNERFE